ncbi:MAG: sigma-70 family RNA polymerase sigma factor [Bryobacteraceae bacterium]|jgi:RNA polymerase sigma-70 factor (ECF subfamily)
MWLLPILLAVGAAERNADLVLRLQRRDPRALAELYDRYGRLAYALILRVVRDVGAAEDLVQETFLRVWTRSRAFDPQKGAIGPWLLAVARHRAIDYLRSADGRERNSVEFEETDHPSLFTGMEQRIPASDRARRVQAAVEKLSASQRQVIELAYFEGLTQTEMAERMGQPLGAVKAWVRAAWRNLRHQISTAEASA